MIPPPIIKYPGIPYLEEDPGIIKGDVMVFEKLDGGNCQIHAALEHLQLATRSGDYSSKTREHLWFGEFQTWANAFYRSQQDALGATLEDLLPPQFVLFGEWVTTCHTLQYRPEATHLFHLIDVYDLHSRRFLPYEQGVATATIDGLLPIPTLRTLHKGPVTQQQLEKLMKGSDYKDGDKEGLVIKDYTRQRFAKLVSPQFRERRKGKGIDAYLTEARLRKCALKIRNIGGALTPTTLRKAFYHDLVKESTTLDFENETISAWYDQNAPAIIKEFRHLRKAQ